MRRRRRAEAAGRARDSCSSGSSLLYYVDQLDEALSSETAQCALVHNVVGTARILLTPGPLDLELVNTLLPNSCFSKKKFAAITVRLDDPTCTILLFGSGKCVLTVCVRCMSCLTFCGGVFTAYTLRSRVSKCRTSLGMRISSSQAHTLT